MRSRQNSRKEVIHCLAAKEVMHCLAAGAAEQWNVMKQAYWKQVAKRRTDPQDVPGAHSRVERKYEGTG